jgi:alpha-beta hydrolase superfamily lysophospholipase
MNHSTLILDTSDGEKLAGIRWTPDRPPKAVVQIAHGASEHSARYERLADVLTDAGYAVYAVDHRGHGRTADAYGRFGVARPGGWAAIVRDTRELTERIQQEHPGVPIVLFGHSMGSMIAQGYVQEWGDDLAGVVLSGTTGGSVIDDETLGIVVAMGEGEGADEPSAAFSAMFAGFNEPFSGPDATGFEWLSRDAGEVKKYVDDPWCGEPLSNGFVADMLSSTAAMWKPEAEARVATDLPIYLFSGDQDPVGGELAGSVRDLAGRYEALGAGPVTLRIYEGGRHEMLNETNRDEVHADLLAWLETLDL